MNNLSLERVQDENVKRMLELVKNALDGAHQTYRVLMKTADIRKAQHSSDYDFCFSVAQTEIKRYRNEINSFSVFTGIIVVDITEGAARQKDIGYWKSVLNFTEMIIYADTARTVISKALLEKMFKELFRESR